MVTEKILTAGYSSALKKWGFQSGAIYDLGCQSFNLFVLHNFFVSAQYLKNSFI